MAIDLTRYRIENSDLFHDAIKLGMIKPDTTLQAIAGAPRCEHGNIYPHLENSRGMQYECEGSPEAAGLLDALTQEDTDGS